MTLKPSEDEPEDTQSLRPTVCLSAQGSLRPRATEAFALTTITVLSIFYQRQSRHMLYLQRS